MLGTAFFLKLFRIFFVGPTTSKQKPTNEENTASIHNIIIIPVSYTHLDVYKRQGVPRGFCVSVTVYG